MSAGKRKRAIPLPVPATPTIRSAETLEVRDMVLWAERWHDHIFLWSRERARGVTQCCAAAFRLRLWPSLLSQQIELVNDVGGATRALYLGLPGSMHLWRICGAWAGCARELIPEVQTIRVPAPGLTDDATYNLCLAGLHRPTRPAEGFRAYQAEITSYPITPMPNPPVLSQNPIRLMVCVMAPKALGGPLVHMRREIVLPYLPRVNDTLRIADAEPWRTVASVAWSKHGFDVWFATAPEDHLAGLEAAGWECVQAAAPEASPVSS